MKSTICFGLLLIALGTGCSKKSASSGSDGDNGALIDRQERIKENIDYHLREALGGRSVHVGPVQESDFSEFDKSSFSVGRDSFPILVSKNDDHILLLAGDPIKMLSHEEIAASLEKETQAEQNAARERSAKLDAEAAESPVRGNADAGVTIVEFSDFECPYCRRGYSTMKELLEKHGADIRLVYMHFPLPMHPWARESAVASACAAQQGDDAFWTLHDYYFQHQNVVKVDNVIDKSRGALEGSGIDLSDWQKCATDSSSSAHMTAVSLVDSQMQLGRESGVSGTPGFFVNGTFISGAQPLEVFEKAIEEAKTRL